MVAVVLGTALSLSQGQTTTAAAEPAPQVVSDMGRYCTTCWRNARLPIDAWGDCTQDVFTRLLERVPVSGWGLALRGEGEEHREFLRAIDAVKKRTQRARKHSSAVEAVADVREPHTRQLDEDREALSSAAEGVLSARQQRILGLSLDGWTVQDIAHELAMPVERVSDEKYKAIRKLRVRLSEERADNEAPGEPTPRLSRLPA